jgi:hypothetical protein
MLTALAATITAIEAQSAGCSAWCSTTSPISAANTGFALM